MSRTTALRRQHDAATKLASRILEKMNSSDWCEEVGAISLDLAKLLGLLRIHLAQEDRCLYPALIASGDTRVAAIARRFITEMGGLSEHLDRFASRWSCPKAISSDFDLFRGETNFVLRALGERIRRENEQLYPLADSLAAAPLRSVA